MGHARRRFVSTRSLGIALACVVLGACYYPPPPPYVEPAPRALSITAQRNQSQARQDRDKADCQSIASAQANSSASWAQIFGGCMNGRGYLVQ
jgi:hypothetical protein